MDTQNNSQISVGLMRRNRQSYFPVLLRLGGPSEAHRRPFQLHAHHISSHAMLSPPTHLNPLTGPPAPRPHPRGPSAGARGRRQAPAAAAALGPLEEARRPPPPQRGAGTGGPAGQGDLDGGRRQQRRRRRRSEGGSGTSGATTTAATFRGLLSGRSGCDV